MKYWHKKVEHCSWKNQAKLIHRDPRDKHGEMEQLSKKGTPVI